MTEVSQQPVIAVCGKGGVGKTAFSALLSKALLEMDYKPLLLVDADPAGGLIAAIGEHVDETLAGAREHLINAARNADDETKSQLAGQLDYLALQALTERSGYALLAMGRNREKGCFCPANSLLRNAIDLLAEPFAAIIIDAEAGLEQINRQVTRRVNRVVVIVDGSQRSRDTLAFITEMVEGENISVVANRLPPGRNLNMDSSIDILGDIPADDKLRIYDIEGRSLWELPPDNPALTAVRQIASQLVSL